jgi:hypothetical protein
MQRIFMQLAEFTVTALPAKKYGPINLKDATPHQTTTFSEYKGS